MPRKTVFDRFNTRFTRDLLVQLGEKAATRALRIWKRTGLPEPRDGEYLYNSDLGVVTVPLNRSGISFVFKSRSRNPLFRGPYEAGLVRDDRVLQPLYRRTLDDNACFEVRPGIKRGGVSDQEVTDIVTSLKKSGLVLKARDAGFIGVLPAEGRNLVVANTSMLRPKGKFDPAGDTVRQDKIYGVLAAQVEDAFVCASTKRIGEMLNTCRDITARKDGDPAKILYASWAVGAQLGPDTQTIVETAQAYSRRFS